MNPAFYHLHLGDTKNLGTGLAVPYYLSLNNDKRFHFTNKLYVDENPLFMGEYRQAFKNSRFNFKYGLYWRLQKTSTKKVGGDKSHFFGKFSKVLINLMMWHEFDYSSSNSFKR